MIRKIENDKKTTHLFTYLVQPNLNFYLKQANHGPTTGKNDDKNKRQRNRKEQERNKRQ